MKIEVTGIETIEVTDPKGFCMAPASVSGPTPPQVAQPVIPNLPVIPWSIYSKTLPTVVTRQDPDHDQKWGLGLPSGSPVDATKWEKSWQAKMSATQGQTPVTE